MTEERGNAGESGFRIHVITVGDFFAGTVVVVTHSFVGVHIIFLVGGKAEVDVLIGNFVFLDDGNVIDGDIAEGMVADEIYGLLVLGPVEYGNRSPLAFIGVVLDLDVVHEELVVTPGISTKGFVGGKNGTACLCAGGKIGCSLEGDCVVLHHLVHFFFSAGCHGHDGYCNEE